MGLMDVLKQYAGASLGQTGGAASDHFQEVAQSAPAHVVAQGISAAMQSDQTPPFGQMVGQLFQQANPQQQAGMLNQLLSSLGPGALAGVAGGALAKFLPTSGATGGAPAITPDQASQLSPQQVQQIAEHAQQQSPSIIDEMSGFYAQHPGLVKTLGGAALTIALAKISSNMRG